MHAQLDEWTKFFIALAPCLSGVAMIIGALNNVRLRKQDKQMEVHDQKIDKLSEDVNGRVNQLVESEAAKAKMEAVMEAVVEMKQKE